MAENNLNVVQRMKILFNAYGIAFDNTEQIVCIVKIISCTLKKMNKLIIKFYIHIFTAGKYGAVECIDGNTHLRNAKSCKQPKIFDFAINVDFPEPVGTR